jgi:hypothetical protein
MGLPGARRLMYEFDVVTEAGRGTTITMTKWCRSPDTPGTAGQPAEREKRR